MKLEPELPEPASHRSPDFPRIRFVLESNNKVVATTRNDDIALSLAPTRAG
jgi:hypothetical protein